mgnify:CR=1 FL=1
MPHKLRKVSITSPHFGPQRWMQHQGEWDRLGIQQCSGEGAVKASLISNRFRGHISLNTSYELQEVYKAWLQSAVAPSFLPPVLGPIRHNEDECLSVRQDILLLKVTHK